VRGHVRKRGATWAAVVDISRDPATGKRRQRWHSGFKTKKEAEHALTEILGRIGRGEYVVPSTTTLGAYLEEWLSSIQTRVRASTYESYARNIRLHILPRLGDTPLQCLGAVQLNGLYSRLLTDGRADGAGGLAPRTVRYVHVILHKSLRDAVRWSLLTRNPADFADPPTPKSARAAEMRTWSATQLRAFLQHTAPHRLHAAFVLAATTGMRRGEIAGLKWADLDEGASRLAVRRSLVTAGYEVVWSDPKTERSRRNIALDPATVGALRAHRARQAREKLALGPAYQDQDLVFAREDGQLMHPERLSKLFALSVRDAKLPRIRFHDLRHTHATLALQAGVHPKIVSERLGHGDVGVTLNTYSHAIPALEEEAAARVAALVFGA
jgi:integrase